MSRGPSPNVPKRQLGVALRARREALKIEREAVAEVLDCSPSKIGRIEIGEVGVRSSELRDILDLLQFTGRERTDLELLGKETRKRRPRTTYGSAIPDWFRKYINLEEEASEIKIYDNELVTGMLQLPEYTHAVLSANPLIDPDDVDRLTQARIARQARLESDNPPQLWIVLNEAVLHREVGGPGVMRDQIRHLRTLSRRPNVTLQIIPFSVGAHAATGFPFTLLRFANDDGWETVYFESITTASYIDNKPDEQQKYSIVFSHVTRAALSAAASRKLMDTLLAEP